MKILYSFLEKCIPLGTCRRYKRQYIIYDEEDVDRRRQLFCLTCGDCSVNKKAVLCSALETQLYQFEMNLTRIFCVWGRIGAYVSTNTTADTENPC